MFDPDIEEDREILDAVEEEEGEQTEDQHIQESQVETTAERTSALLEGRGASMAQTFGYEEAPEEKEVISDLQEEQDRNLAERQRARDEQQELEDLQLERLTAGVAASRRNLEQGRRPLAGFSNPNEAVRTHAENIGMTLPEFQERVSNFGIGLDGILSDIAYNGTSSEDALRIAREYNPMMGTAQERADYRESIRTRDRFMESFRERGQALPSHLSEDSYVFDSETSSWSGTQADELETTARTGDASYVASELRVQGLLSDPEVARYVREYEASALGGEDYFDARLTGLMEDFLELNPEATTDQRDAAFDRFGNQIMAELASLKTVGLWTMPIFLRRERIDASGWHYGVGDTSWLQALSPRIEVVGTHRRGRGRVTVLRQAGALDTLFRIADAPKSAIVGALTGRGARAGVAEGLQAMDAFGQAASGSTFMGGMWNSSFGIGTAQLAGLAIDVIFPDALVFGALLGKVTGRAATLARVSREARGFTKDAERLLDAFNANNSEEFALIERQMAVKYPILTQRVDSAQSQMRELLKKANPDIVNRDLAARLPLRSGNLEINLSPDMRRSRTRLTGEVEEFTETTQTRRAEETLSQPLYTRGQNSTIDDFHYQRQVVLGDLDTVNSPSYDIWSGLAPQANRVTSSYRDEITKVLVKSGDAGASTVMANRISETLVDLIKNPRKWKDDTYEFVRNNVPGVGRDARMNAGERVEAFILRMQRSGTPLSAEEIVDIRRASSARKAIEEQLRFMANAVVGYRNKLKGEGLDPAQLVEEHTALLKRALEAVETNQQARIAAVYMVYSETHGWGSVLTKPLRLGKMRTDLIDSDLFADLDEFRQLTEEAAFFASELRTVFTNIDRRQSIMLARLMDSRARTWAAKNERKVSEWWELNFGRIESKGDMRKALRARGRRDPDVDTDADADVDTDADADVDTDADLDVGDDGSKPLGEVEEPIDEDAFVDAPEYQEPPRPSVENTVLAGTGRRLPTSKNKDFGQSGEWNALDPESPGHSAEFLYDHLVEFDSRLNPNNGGAQGVLAWMSRHSRHPATRTLAERLKRIVPENEGFYIQDTVDGNSMLRPALKGRRADPGYGGVFGAPSGFLPIKSQTTGYRRGADSLAGAWRVAPYGGRPGHVVVPGTRTSNLGHGASLNDQVLLHEFLHSATVEAIRNPSTPAVRAVRDKLNALGQDILAYSEAIERRLLAKAKKKAEEQGEVWEEVSHRADLYLNKADKFTLQNSRRMQRESVLGATDGNYAVELISYGLTHPDTQRFLKEMPMGETRSVIDETEYVTKGLREGLREQSGFNRFVELISDLLSIFGKKFTKQETTVLHRVISVSDELLSSIETAKGLRKGVSEEQVLSVSTEIASRYRRIDGSRNVLNDLVSALPEGEGGVWLTNILNTIKRGWDTRPSAEPDSVRTLLGRISTEIQGRGWGSSLRKQEEVFVEAADALISELTEALRVNSFFKREMTEAGRTDSLAYIESSLDDFVSNLEALRDSARGGFLTSSEVPQFAVRSTPTSVALRPSRSEAPAGITPVKTIETIGGQSVTSNVFSLPGGRIKLYEDSPFAPNRSHSIVDFVVDESERGQGIGSRLVDEVLRTYPDKEISAQVSSLASLRVFHNKGFRHAGEELAFEDLVQVWRNEGGSLNMRRSAAAPPALPPSDSRLVQDNYLGDLSRFSPTMYREVSGSEVLSFLPGARSRVDMRRETFFSNDPTLALAQGRGGFVVEVESSGLQGKLSKRKPGWQASYDQFGTAEFIAKHNEQALYQGAVRSIEVKPNAQISRSERARLRRGLSEWNKTELPDGTVRYTPPRADVPEVQKSAAPVRADIDTPEFRNWFGDSKVVDDAGEPLVVYHGSDIAIDTLDPSKATQAERYSNVLFFSTDAETAGRFSGTISKKGVVRDRRGGRRRGAAGRAIRPNITPVYLRIKNPFDPRVVDIDSFVSSQGLSMSVEDIASLKKGDYSIMERPSVAKAIRDAGYDGTVSREIRFRGEDVEGAWNYGVFEASQIRSVFGPTAARRFTPARGGTFDPSDARVQRSAAPPTAVPPTGSGLSMRMLNDIEDGRAVLRAFDDSETFVDLVQSIGQVIRRDMDQQELNELLVFLKGPPHKLDVDVRGANFIGPDAVRAEQVFAQSFERYVRGGEDIAPSKGLRGVFYHCRVALGHIYAGIRADTDLGIAVAPEISAVLDRMLTDVPTAGKVKDFRRALVMNLRGVASGRFEGLGRAVKDTPIGVNADLGSVSVAARISEELRRLTKPSDKDVTLLTEEEITSQIDDLIDQVSRPGSSLTGDSARITFDVPVLSRIYGPQGKDTFSLNELVSLQSRLEAERAEALTETLPSAFEQARGAAIQELTPVEQLRNLVQDGGLKKAVLFTFFGGDPAALGKMSLRGLPPIIRAEINGGGRIIEEAYGNMMRLLQEGNMTTVAEFLAGKSVKFEFGGRAALSSGYDSFAAVSRQLALAMDDIKITTANGTVLEGEDLIEQIERFFSLTHPHEATRTLYREKLPTVSLDEPLIAQAYNDTVRMLFSQMDPSKSTSFTRDVGSALGITNNPTGGQQLIFAEAMLYYMGITRRNGKKITDGMPTGALVDKTAQDAMLAFETQRVSDFLRETVNAYKSKPSARATPDGISNRNRVALLIAGHGQVERVINNLYARGLVATEIDQINFKRWLTGEALSPRETIGAMKLMRKFGMNPRLGEDPLLEAGVYLPQAARRRISEALARGMAPSKQSLRELGINASEQDIAGIIGGLIRYMKLRMTRGAMALRQRYFLMNTIDHMSQMAYKAGFRVAMVSGTRVVAQNVMVLPAVARSLALVDLGKPGSMERFRKVLQKGGDKAARAVATMLRVSVYRVDLNDVLEGKEGFVRLGKRVYSNQQIREIMVEEGIFASFDTRALADVVSDDVRATSTRFRGAYNVTLGMVTDVAEAWAERERAGAVLTLIEAGVSPRAACRVTIDALFDYAGTMSKVDRSWWMSLLFPFWAFQKNANTQVFNLTLSPAGAYRMGVVRRFLDGTPDYFGQLLAVQLSENPDTGMPTPYGIYLGGLTQQQRELYYEVVRRLEFGYGEISEMLPEQLRRVLSSYGVNRVEDLSPEQIQIIENGFGPAYAMPEETRQAIRSLFAGAQGGRVVGGTYLRATGRMRDVISQTGLVETTPMNRNRTGPRARNRFDEFIRMTRQVAMPEMGDNEIRSYMRNRGRLPIPPVLNDITRQYYETLRYYQNARGEIESPYLELLLPDSTINAGYRHIANLSAAYILALYGPLSWAFEAGSELTETPMTLEDFNIEADPFSRGLSPMTPFREVLDIESTPIPGPVLEYITDERLGYPRRVHPILGSMVENFFPGYSVLRIDPTVGEQSDPYLQAEALTFANRAEYDEYVSSGNREVMLMQERVYMPPGISRFMFENSPLGELNRILMTMPTKVPFTDIGLREEAAGSIDYRSMYEQVQDPEQLIQWARFLLGIDVKETSPTRTARIEEREIPDELQ